MNAIDAWKLLPEGSAQVTHRKKNKDNRNIVNDFSTAFGNALKKVDSSQKEAERLEKMFVSGEIETVHEVMLAAEKAKLALEFTIEIRNKLLEAYKAMERMQV